MHNKENTTRKEEETKNNSHVYSSEKPRCHRTQSVYIYYTILLILMRVNQQLK